MSNLAYSAWAFIDNGWVLVGEERTNRSEAKAICDDLSSHGIENEVRKVDSDADSE
jgi:hypothetical protein